MKLRYSPTSPFVRKATVTAAEKGLEDRVERVPTDPWAAETDLPDDNPLSKVPTLILDDGRVLHDSPVICDYLDSLSESPVLIPAAGADRWDVLTMQSTGDGILEAAVLYFLENEKRPEEARWPWWSERQVDKIRRTLDMLERTPGCLEGPINLGQITVGVALGYVDFRLPHEDWRSERPHLAAWYRTFAARPAMRATVPANPA